MSYLRVTTSWIQQVSTLLHVSGLLSIVALGTRKRVWCVLTSITSLILFAVSLYHIYAVNDHAINYWNKFRQLAETDGKAECYNRGGVCLVFISNLVTSATTWEIHLY